MGIMQLFAAAGGDSFTLVDHEATSEAISPATATASFSLANDGDIDGTAGSNTIVDIGDWLSPKTNMSAYECQMDIVSGSFTSGTTGSRLSLGASRTWTKAQATNGSSSVVGTLTIYRISDGAAVDSATITLTATRLAP